MRRDPVLSFVAGAAIGAGLMFLLDPDRGPAGGPWRATVC